MAEIRLLLRGDLCAGSGEATGKTVDSDLCIDEQGFPYVPARRLKGVLREAGELLRDCGATTDEAVQRLFGTSERAGQVQIADAVFPEIEALRAYLSGQVPPELKRAAAPLYIAKLFTSVRGQTRLENGVAADGSLRYIRVLDRHNALHPERETELRARVTLAPEADAELFRLCCAAVRHIGSNRNRGLGNVCLRFSSVDTKKSIAPPTLPEAGERLRISYTLVLDAPLTLPGCAEQLDEIPSRSVIGCLAGQYLSAQNDPASAEFAALFLNGTVRWSSLTPRICGQRSKPAPLSLLRIKDTAEFVNRASAAPNEYQEKKCKDVEGSFFVETENGGLVGNAHSHTVYHHSHRNDTLYMQESLDAGMLYSGEVEVPRALAERVLNLLCEGRFSFGRSKSAQYGACTLLKAPEIAPIECAERRLPEGTAVWVLLESDLVLCKDGTYVADGASVRAALASLLRLEDQRPEGAYDYCQNRMLSGYQAKWNLPKPQIPAIRGGSLFVFRAGCEPIAAERRLGEFPQEGLGAFRVLTEAEMRSFGTVSKAQVDLHKAEPGSEGAALEQAMLGAELDRLFGEAVSELFHETYDPKLSHSPRIRPGTLGRVRQMLTEARDFDRLKEMIHAIKASDQHSDNLEPDRDKAERLAQDVWERTCDRHRSLLRLYRGDRYARWKTAMEQMIDLLYYGK